MTRRTDPYTEQELRDMLANGDTVAAIRVRAHRVNGWGVARVREVLFGRAY